MYSDEGALTMRRLDFGSSLRVALVALAALLALGIAFHGDIAEERAQPDRLVDRLGAEDLRKFAVVDMVDALERVAGDEALTSD